MFGNQLRHANCGSSLSLFPLTLSSLSPSLSISRSCVTKRRHGQNLHIACPKWEHITSVAGSTSSPSPCKAIKWQSLMRHFRGSCCLLIAYKTHTPTHTQAHTYVAYTCVWHINQSPSNKSAFCARFHLHMRLMKLLFTQAANYK